MYDIVTPLLALAPYLVILAALAAIPTAGLSSPDPD
jgi:hypothetical protein